MGRTSGSCCQGFIREAEGGALFVEEEFGGVEEFGS